VRNDKAHARGYNQPQQQGFAASSIRLNSGRSGSLAIVSRAGSLQTKLSRIDQAFQEQRLNGAAESNSTINFDDRNRFTELPHQLWVIIDLHNLNGWQCVLKLQQRGQSIFTQMAFPASQQAAGTKKGTAISSRLPWRRLQQNCGGKKHRSANDQMQLSAGIPDRWQRKHFHVQAITEDHHGKCGSHEHHGRPKPRLNAIIDINFTRTHGRKLPAISAISKNSSDSPPRHNDREARLATNYRQPSMTNNFRIIAIPAESAEIHRGMARKTFTKFHRTLPNDRFLSPDPIFRLNALQNSATIPVVLRSIQLPWEEIDG